MTKQSADTAKPLPPPASHSSFLSKLLVFSFAFFLRYTISTHGYSGQATPPLYGDYEAQRHWLEITYNLSPRDWYRNTSDNDLLYWGLDYPPLTAYHSYTLAAAASKIEPELIALYSSRGHESPQSKLFMRATVLVSDILIYFTGLWLFFSRFYKPSGTQHLYLALLALCNPALMLIDHGHFQYNAVSLGFFVWAVHLITAQRKLLGSIAFVLSLAYKQMSLYYSPAFFFFLLAAAIHERTQRNGAAAAPSVVTM